MSDLPKHGGRASPDLTEPDPRLVVALPRSGAPGGVIAAVAIACAVLLFTALEGKRRSVPTEALADRRAQANVFSSAPPLIIPPEPAALPSAAVTLSLREPEVELQPRRQSQFYRQPAPGPIIVPVPAPQTTPPPAAPASGGASRLERAPALVFDSEGDGTDRQSSSPSSTAGNGGQQRASGSGEDAPVRATLIRSRTTIMPTGTVISATLETPIDSARPGLVRAVVSQDARGFDGQRVLVPRGSRLIGEYQSDVRSGQSRVLVTWSRLIRPDGVSIRIGSPAADQLGGAGIPGRVNSFFFQRFASAVLQSALTVGVNLASQPGRGSVIVGLPAAPVTNVVNQSVLGADDLRPKIKVKQGTALHVFVARDLDFSGTPASR